MSCLTQELVRIEELPFVLDDLEKLFKDTCPQWTYIWYRISGDDENIYLVAYTTREELLQKEKDR
jgi:hypothetical protein